MNMLDIDRQTDYAARIVLHLASHDLDDLVSITKIASSRKLPIPFVRRIVSRLALSGILRTVRGVGGGIALARSPSQITMFDVVTAMNGPTCPSPCLENPEGCPFGKSCPVQGVWAKSGQVLDTYFRSVRFADLANAPGHSKAHQEIAKREANH